jgi:hypothetical protein
LDWTNRITEDALHLDKQIETLLKSFGLQLIFESILHRVDILIRQEQKDEDDYLYTLKSNLEKTLEDYKNRYGNVE